MIQFEYVDPKNIKSVPALLEEFKDKSLLFAGGTDALSRMKEGIETPNHVINLKAVKDLDFIREEDDGLHIGATTKLTDVIKNRTTQKWPGLIEAANSIGTIQLRNMGTVGGNLCQRPRCWYFRSRHFPCLKKEGDTCFAIYGENKYHAILGASSCWIVHPSDLAPMLIALGAKVKLQGIKEDRELALEDLYVLPDQDPYNETVLKPDELITEVIVPKANGKSHYLKFKERQSQDFAMVSVAVAAQVSGKKLTKVRIVLGGVAPKPWRAKAAEKALEGKTATKANLKKAGEAELALAEPLEQNAYKVILTKNMIKRAVEQLIA
jgi:xanthine dehydrogenase YagS FAD-binding subunit